MPRHVDHGNEKVLDVSAKEDERLMCQEFVFHHVGNTCVSDFDHRPQPDTCLHVRALIQPGSSLKLPLSRQELHSSSETDSTSCTHN